MDTSRAAMEDFWLYQGLFSLIYTCRSMRAELTSARDALLAAPLPPGSLDEDGGRKALQVYGQLAAIRAKDGAEQIIMQQRIFSSPWFDPQQVRLLLPELIKLALLQLMRPADVTKSMDDLRRRFADPLSIYTHAIPFVSVDDAKDMKLELSSPFFLKCWNRRWKFRGSRAVMTLCSFPDMLLQPPFDEERIQLLWMFRQMRLVSDGRAPEWLQDRKQRHMAGVRRRPKSRIKVPVGINADLLCSAIEYAISTNDTRGLVGGNYDAVTALFDIRESFQFAFGLKEFVYDETVDSNVYSSEDQYRDGRNDLIKPEWHMLAAKQHDSQMVQLLAQLDGWSVPYWDAGFAQWAADPLQDHMTDYASDLAYWVLQRRKNLASKKLPSGQYKRFNCPPPPWGKDDDFELGYDDWLWWRESSHRQRDVRNSDEDGVEEW